MDIEFQGEYTKEQYFRAVRLAGRPSKRSLIWRIAIFVLFAGLLIAYAVAAGQDGERTAAESTRLVRYLVTGGLLAYFVAAPFIKTEQTAAKLWSDPLVRRRLSGYVSGLGITVGSYTEPWEKFAWKYLTDDLVVLVTGERTMSLLPRSFFRDEADWRAFREMVDHRVVVAK
ncbi:MAG TPA: hypothetical protein VIO36_05860 [Anaerolineaceae bacterium]